MSDSSAGDSVGEDPAGPETVDFLMSGDTQVREAIATLARMGYDSVRRNFNEDSNWRSLTLLTVRGDGDPETTRAIVRTVRRIDPGAIRL